MSLSPMHEIFILLEDEKEVPLYRLNRWGRQTRGVLAKLKRLNWIEKKFKDGEPYYRITPLGERAVDGYLKPLKDAGKWDGKWRLVMFDVPESKRSLRDTLRRRLEKLGMGILQASVWITPKNVKKEIEELSEKFQLGNSLKFFEVSQNANLDQTILKKSWNLPGLAEDYERFNIQAKHTLKSIDKDPNPRFAAKKLIFQYALILQKDPILPEEYRQQDQTRKESNEIYLKLRTYAV